MVRLPSNRVFLTRILKTVGGVGRSVGLGGRFGRSVWSEARRQARLGRLKRVNETTTAAPSRSTLLTQLLRAICHLGAVLVITFWALTAWPLPLPGLLTGAAALVLTVLIWALFLSPKPVLRTDRFGQALIELLLIAGAVGALLSLGANWVVAVLFGLVAAVIGYLGSTAR